jgi:hypothetical protein
MDYSNLCLIFSEYWHVYFKKKALSKWITQIYVSFFRSTGTCQKNGVLSHYRAEKLKNPSTEMPILLINS